MAQRTRVIVIGWEGADWKLLHSLIDAGQLPHFEALVNEGTIGELATLQPQLDPLLLASLATGCRGDRHDVLDFYAFDGDAARPTLSSDRMMPAVWSRLNAHGLRTHVVGWPGYPAEPVDGVFVSQLFSRHGDGSVDFRALPRVVCPLAAAEDLDRLRVRPTEISLDDILPFVPRAADVDQENDPGLAIIASWLAEWATTHNAATHLVAGNDWDFAWVHYDAIDRFGHAFMRFHPPPMPGLSERSFALYQHVISTVYRLADMQFGRLVELAGEGATVMVCSAHGLRSGADRPKPTDDRRSNVSWHRPLGVLAMRGPRIQRDEWLWGGTILDICPTILSLFGLPLDDQLDGRPMVEALAAPSQGGTAQKISTATTAPAATLNDAETQVLVRQLVDDGYLAPDTPQGCEAVQRTADARAFNLAQVYLDAGRVAEAAKLLDALVARRPEVGRFALQLAQCRLALGDPAGCAAQLEKLANLEVPDVYARRLRAELHLAEGDPQRALVELFDIEQAYSLMPDIHLQIGQAYVALEQWGEARRAFEKELQRNADHAGAHFGLGRVAEVEEDFEQAVDHFLQVVAVTRRHPEAHYRLGVALGELGRTADALVAVERCLAQRPDHEEALALVAKLKCQAVASRGDGI